MTIYAGVDPLVLRELAADVRQLTEAIPAPVRQSVRVPGRARRRVQWVAITHPSLLEALRAAVERGSASWGSHRHAEPRSTPPLYLDPLDALAGIYAALSGWRWRIIPGHRVDPDDDWQYVTLRALVGAAPNLAPAVAGELANDVHDWWASAARHAGWSTHELITLRS